jgi:sterol desaturase/sphingolipid hydroxylase (fatty acid hydroxylase superfamily)
MFISTTKKMVATNFSAIIFTLFAATILCLIFYFETQSYSHLFAVVEDRASRFYRFFWLKTFGSWELYAGFAIVFVAQRYIPAQSYQNSRRNISIDLVWTFVWILNLCLLVPVYFFGLKYLLSPAIIWIQQLQFGVPRWLVIVLGYFVADFLGWFHHFVRHKVRLFWEFHKIHHSQTFMNPLTVTRVHPVDQIIAGSIKILPAVFFKDGLGIAISYMFFHTLQDRLVHSNIKSNWGWLRYVLVTPQSHRVHHSGEKAFYDKNFGVSFSIWDHLFGTQCKDYNVYPTTGVPDPNFPCETKIGGSLIKVVWLQLIYPFSACKRLLLNK